MNIYDVLSGEGTTTFTEVEAGDEPKLIVSNNEEKKQATIKTKQLEVKFISTADVNLRTFVVDEDDRWYVEYFVGSLLKFVGFLVVDEMQEAFLDSSASNEVTLVATDNIGLLKDLPLQDFTGGNPRGEFPLIQYAAWALAQTGLQLRINLIHNLCEEHNPGVSWYQTVHLNAKTFERDVNFSISPYEVLQIILGEDGYVSQQDGEWYLVRVDQLGSFETLQHRYDYLGHWQDTVIFNPNQAIHPDGTVLFSGMVTFNKIQQAVRTVRPTYNYELPKELIDNYDFSRSDIPFETSAPYVDPLDGKTKVDKKFALQDWFPYSPTAGDTPSATYIKRVYEDDYEKERFLVIEAAGASKLTWVRSNPMYINRGDKFTLSVTWRYASDVLGVGASLNERQAKMIIQGHDGSWWDFGVLGADPEEIPRWRQVSATVLTQSTIQTGLWDFGQADEDQRQWKTASIDSTPAPVTGELLVVLIHDDFSLHFEKNFQPLQFTYKPLVNGSYSKYEGQYSEITQTLLTKRIYEPLVKISDSPNRNFKGALLTQTGWFNFLTGGFLIQASLSRIILSADLGDRTADFPAGRIIVITGTTSNNGYYRVISSDYVGGSTRIVVEKIYPSTPMVDEAGVTLTAGRGTFEAAGRLYDGRLFTAGLPSVDNLHPFSWHQAYALWNQYRRPFSYFDFQCQGLNAAFLLCDITHKYWVFENSSLALEKQFMLLHFEQDHSVCEWKGALIEVNDSTIEKDYLTPLTFKYKSG
jgi:hypothetical protein